LEAKRLIKKLVIIVLTAALALAGLIVCAPLYLPGLLSFWLSDRGVTVNRIQLRVPNVNTWVIPALEIQSDAGVRFEAETLVLHYQLGKLLSGRVDAVDIKNLLIDTGAATSVSDSPTTFPSLSGWLESLPANRLTVDNGSIDARLMIDNLALQLLSDSVVLEGRFLLDGEEIRIDGNLGLENTFQLIVQSPLGKSNLEGTFDANHIRGEGTTDFDIALIKPWLPPELVDFDGRLNSHLNFTLSNRNGETDLQTEMTLKGKLSSPSYFDSLVINQQLRLAGSPQSPQLTLLAGEALVIAQLRKPIQQSRVAVALTSDLNIDDIVKNFTVTEKAALQVRTDRDSVDMVFNGKRIAINGNLSSIFPDLYLSSDMILEKSSPLRLRLLSGSTASLGKIAGLGNTTAELQSDVVLVNDADTFRLGEQFTTSIKTDSGNFTLQGQGDFRPAKLKLSIDSNDLIWQGQSYGPATASVNISENVDIKTVANVKILDTNIQAEGVLDPITLKGQFTAGVDKLSQLNNFLSRQCIEITSGNVQLKGILDLNDRATVKGDLALRNFSISIQDTPINNIQFSGQWSFDNEGVFEGFSTGGNLEVPVLGFGVRIEDLSTQLRWRGDSIFLDQLEGRVLGGHLRGKNLQWQLKQQRNELLLYLDEIDLRQLIALEDYSGLEVSGKINATLPLVVDSAGVQVVGGRIEAVRPGGEIHLPVDSSNRTGAQKEAFDALQNFHYEVLSGGVSGPLALDRDGLLVSQLTLKGRNPDMGRPITLNLTIEQNTYPIFQTLELFNRINRIGQCSPQ
jgi:hypothetical protein